MSIRPELRPIMPFVKAIDLALEHIVEKVTYEKRDIFQMTDGLWVCVCISENETHPLLFVFHPDKSIEVLGDTEHFNIHQYAYKDLSDFASYFPYNPENVKRITEAIQEKQNRQTTYRCNGCDKRCECEVRLENTL